MPKAGNKQGGRPVDTCVSSIRHTGQRFCTSGGTRNLRAGEVAAPGAVAVRVVTHVDLPARAAARAQVQILGPVSCCTGAACHPARGWVRAPSGTSG